MERDDAKPEKFSVLNLAVGVLIVLVLGMLALPILGRRSHHRCSVVGCANNLSQLWKMEQVYRARFGGPGRLYPSETGSDFWLKLTSVSLIDSTVADIYTCNRKPTLAAPGQTHYRGPTGDVNSYRDEDPVGGDGDMGSSTPGEPHPGEGRSGNVLRASGDVNEYAGADWEALNTRIKY